MNPPEPSEDQDTTQPKLSFVRRLRGLRRRFWAFISRRYFVIVFILFVALVVWGIASFFPAPMKPFAGTILGWVLGLLSVPFVEAVKSSRETQQLARLLKTEVTFNSEVLHYLKNRYQRFADLSGLPIDSSGIPTVLPPPPNQFRFTVFNATLGQHGLLPTFAVQALHDFYWHLTQIETLRQAWEEHRSDRSYNVHSLLCRLVEEAAAALKVGSPSSLIAELQYHSDVGIFRRMVRFYM